MDKDLEIYEVNLAVSNACNADCIYCPRSFVQAKNKFMSLETVNKIASEIETWQFKDAHAVVHSVVSENGEPFLNPQILDILRRMREIYTITERPELAVTTTGMAISMFSNFALITEDIAEVVIRERLTDTINFNIDGLTPESYRAVKGLDLGEVESNIRKFIEIRDKMKSPIRLLCHVISHYTYTTAVEKVFGVPPVKWKSGLFPQDGPETVKRWQGILTPGIDAVGEDSVMFWAERYNKNQIPVTHGCPNIGRVRHVAYINPDGNAYGCCFDMGNDLVIGNVLETSILEVMQSEKRKQLIGRLENRKFEEIGWPCTRVDACGGMNRGEIV
jgi:radical SAM protein with 4Fe4S-binding SPASM domain